MEEKLVTLVVLPFSNAQILKTRLEENGIECELEEISLIEGTVSYSVQVKILEKDVQKALPVMNDFLGKKPVEDERRAKKQQHILVPVDFSESSEKALITAINIAKILNRKLVLMHCFINPMLHAIPYSDVYVYDSSFLTKMEDADKLAKKNFQKFITNVTDKVSKETWEKLDLEFLIKPGYAEDDILQFTQKYNTQLIVMGTGGNTNATNAVGSITADVMYNARVPVLVVPEKSQVKELNELSKVLYATNFDEKDFAVLDKLMKILKPFHTKIICTHVGQPKGNGWDLARLEGMKDILHEKYKDLEFECHLIVGKNIEESLEKFIEEEKIDVLSLTTHKRSMISRLFNPSLARKMAYHVTTPLLVFHA